jgi:centrosomal protein CEP97
MNFKITPIKNLINFKVQQLQLSMRDIINCVSVFSQLPVMQQSTSSSSSMTNSQFRDSSETQTEIIAVHTPQIEHPREFPFVMQKVQRPSSLPITSSNDSSVSTRSSQNNTATTGDDEPDQNNTNDSILTSAN